MTLGDAAAFPPSLNSAAITAEDFPSATAFLQEPDQVGGPRVGAA